ncbi:MAG: saccharopine dehydrogenase NADP-binding domain-containing protein [Candidatus Promineifilaceae bacterium]|nr:saccharopine dehydrogenase NADP-binding domain-containing protein [Candidatus Promineifilaceae bacterium]
MPSLLIYGAYGYTGRLISEHAVERGLQPILAGRDGAKVSALAGELKLDHRTFSLDDPTAVTEGLSGIHTVLHAAGPYSATARPMLDGCLAEGVHYLDITGEIAVFELAASLDEAAKAREIMLLPGVGFDVVPSDCAAALAARRVPRAHNLALGILGPGRISRGTARTRVEVIDQPTRVRREGEIVNREPGSLTRAFDFGRGDLETVAVSWGDVATAYYSTGIPNITVYFPAKGLSTVYRLADLLRPLVERPAVKELLKRAISLRPAGPSERQREKGTAVVIAEVRRGGRVASERIETPGPYKLTYIAAVDAARRVLDGEWTAGFQTPSLAFGAEYVLSLPECQRI